MLGDDLQTLYFLALSCRLFSTVALPALYSHLEKFPSDYDDEDRLAEDMQSYTTRLIKWSSLWKSLAKSAQNPHSTTMNYVSALRVLNLRDLLSLMDEFRLARGQRVRNAFFANGLEAYNKVRNFSYGKSNQTMFDVNLAADCLTDLIAPRTTAVTTLIRQTTLPDHLHLWVENMTSLKRLQVFSGEVLGDERVCVAVQACPNLKSLEIYHWPTTTQNPDEQLARLFASTAGKLERLVIKNSNSCFRELALSALSHHHGASLKTLEVLTFSPEVLGSLGLATKITNLNSCTIQLSDSLWPAPSEVLDAFMNFISQNTKLEFIDVGLFPVGRILPSAIRELHLKHLSLTILSVDTLLNPFWGGIAAQGRSLESLTLQCEDWIDIFYDQEQLFNAIRQLYKLKSLTLTGPFSVMRDENIEEIVNGCPELEELSCTSGGLTDRSLVSLSKLPKFTTLISR